MTKLRCAPLEPTKEQVEAGELSLRDYEKHPEGRYFVEAFDKTKEIYQAMLAAAPPPSPEIEEALELAECIDTIQKAPTQMAAVILARALLQSWGRE